MLAVEVPTAHDRWRDIDNAYRDGLPVEHNGGAYLVLSKAPWPGFGWRYLLIPVEEVEGLA